MVKKPTSQRTLRVPASEMLKDTPWFEVKGHEKTSRGKLPKFSGELHNPIVQSLSDMPVIDGRTIIDGAIDNIFQQRIDKLILLLKHYEIENTNDPWIFLSFRLACALVPGLRVLSAPPRGRGRPSKWKGPAGDAVIAAVDAERAKTQTSIAASINILKQNDPLRWRSLNEVRYHEARRDQKLRKQAIDALRKNKT
jgi:hypothetical protein